MEFNLKAIDSDFHLRDAPPLHAGCAGRWFVYSGYVKKKRKGGENRTIHCVLRAVLCAVCCVCCACCVVLHANTGITLLLLLLLLLHCRYLTHNLEFAAWAAMYAGHMSTAINACNKIDEVIPESVLRSSPTAPIGLEVRNNLLTPVNILFTSY